MTTHEDRSVAAHEISNTMYPEPWEDFDLVAYANDFYEEFLGYTLDDSAWQIAAWQFDGANANGLSE